MPLPLLIGTPYAAIFRDDYSLLDLQWLWFGAIVVLVMWTVALCSRRRLAAVLVGAVLIALGFFLMVGSWVGLSGI